MSATPPRTRPADDARQHARAERASLDCILSMNKTELAIQLRKIAIGIAFAAYFLWWSLAVLERLPAR
jgi:hypothetical protein